MFISPTSISKLLIICLNGVTMESKIFFQLKCLLNLNEFKDEIILILLKRSLNEIDFRIKKDFVFFEKNKIYLNKDKSFNTDLFASINNKFGVNIDDETTNHDKIILKSLIFFESKWLYQFNVTKTISNVTFHLENGQDSFVQMMHLTKQLNIHEEPNATVCQLPYIGGKMFMTIILPKSNIKLSEIESKLDLLVLKRAFEIDCLKKVKIHLPKFQIEYECEVH